MKISAHTKVSLQRTISALVFATSSAIAQNTAPAPFAPPTSPSPISPPTAPAPIAPPTGGTVAPAGIEPPVTNPVAPTGLPEQPGLPVDASVPPPPSFDVNAAANKVSEFQGDEIGLVLRTLARQANMNVVVSPKVIGTVTLRLSDKSPREVIDVIADSSNLIIEERKGVTYIKTQEEKNAEPTVSSQYTFSYAKATEILPLLTSQLTSKIVPQVDNRTNTVFFRDNESNLPKIKEFLKSVDSPTQQVMIEARLVEVNANPKQAYGLNWAGVVGSSSSAQKISYGASGIGTSKLTNSTIVGPNGIPAQVLQPDQLPGIKEGTTGGFLLNDFLRNGTRGNQFLNSVAGQFAILSIPQMSVTMRLLNEDSDAEFLANPRIVAANNQEATIKITRTQPVPNLTFNEQQAKAVFGGFTDKEFGNTLKVTPIINKDRYVSLKVQPEISNKVGDATFVFEGASVSSPIIDKRVFDSNVLIRSGDTLAIGGLLQDEGTKGRTKVPIAGDIPLFGYLFQEKTASRSKRNLLVFVTPTIIKHGYGTGLESQVGGLTNSGEEYADPNGWRNNAKGAVRLTPTSHRPLAADAPKPGLPPLPSKR